MASLMVPLETPFVVFTLTFNSNISPNSVPLQEIRLRNFSDPELAFQITQGQMSWHHWAPYIQCFIDI